MRNMEDGFLKSYCGSVPCVRRLFSLWSSSLRTSSFPIRFSDIRETAGIHLDTPTKLLAN